MVQILIGKLSSYALDAIASGTSRNRLNNYSNFSLNSAAFSFPKSSQESQQAPVLNSVPEEDLTSNDYYDESDNLLPSEFDLANGGGIALGGSKPVPCGHLCYIAAKLIIDAAFVSLYAV